MLSLCQLLFLYKLNPNHKSTTTTLILLNKMLPSFDLTLTLRKICISPRCIMHWQCLVLKLGLFLLKFSNLVQLLRTGSIFKFFTRFFKPGLQPSANFNTQNDWILHKFTTSPKLNLTCQAVTEPACQSQSERYQRLQNPRQATLILNMFCLRQDEYEQTDFTLTLSFAYKIEFWVARV